MGFDLLAAIMVLVPMILSLTVHEYAHALCAQKLGDDTAERQGRLTLNPLAHIDPVGTVLLPLLILLASSGGLNVPFFGWAKPVPVDPTRFRRFVSVRKGMMLTAAAGPLANVVLAVLAQGFLAAGYHGDWLVAGPVADFAARMLYVNVALALFNMIPVFPLDGQKVLAGVLRADVAIRYERFSMQYGSLLLMGIVLFAGRILAVPFRVAVWGLASLFGMS
jgi:Zn-dependent protease